MTEQRFLNQQIETLQGQIEKAGTSITDDANFAVHVELERSAADLLKVIDEHYDAEINQAHRLHKALLAKKRTISEPVLEFKKAVRVRMIDFHRHRRFEQRLQLEKATVEITTARDREITSRSDLAKEAGLIEESRLINLERSVPVIPSQNKLQLPKGVSERKTVHFTVVDTNAIPRKFLQPNIKAIRKIVEALGTAADIPGVKIWTELDLTVRKKQ